MERRDDKAVLFELLARTQNDVVALATANSALLEALEAIRELSREDVRGPSLVEAWFDEFDALMPQVDAALALSKGTEEADDGQA